MKTRDSKGHCQGISRRQFVAASALAGVAPWIIPSSLLGGEATPSNKITLGMIGTGEHGIGTNVNGFLPQPDSKILAVCDVDSARMARAKSAGGEQYAQEMTSGTYKGCDTTGDFREIINRKDVDAVVISTPDHWHVILSIMAARAGKDVFVEKPMTTSVEEGKSPLQGHRGHEEGSSGRLRATGPGGVPSHVRNRPQRTGRQAQAHRSRDARGHSIRANPDDKRPQMTVCDPPSAIELRLVDGQDAGDALFPRPNALELALVERTGRRQFRRLRPSPD